MLKLMIKRKQFLFFTKLCSSLAMIIAVHPAHPALSKGEKAVMEFNQVLGVVEIVLVTGSSILAVLSIIAYFLGVYLRAQGEPGGPALSTAFVSSLGGAILIILFIIATKQLTPIFATLFTIDCTIFVMALVQALLPSKLN